jgi:hypothetical protein
MFKQDMHIISIMPQRVTLIYVMSSPRLHIFSYLGNKMELNFVMAIKRPDLAVLPTAPSLNTLLQRRDYVFLNASAVISFIN